MDVKRCHTLFLAIGAIGPISHLLVIPFHEGHTLFSREPLGTQPMTTFFYHGSFFTGAMPQTISGGGFLKAWTVEDTLRESTRADVSEEA